MNVLIIEDELQTAWDLKQILIRLRPNFEVLDILDSVETAKEWFSEHLAPDLIFSDIKLGDGLAFEIFQDLELTTPIIFCTAFDEYLLQAFKTNGIDYILKPIQEKEVSASIQKLENLKMHSTLPGRPSLQNISREILGTNYKNTFIVSFREKLYPIEASNILVFKIADNNTDLHTADHKRYSVPYTMDHLEKVLDPDKFYRANRQTILARHAIAEIEHYVERKLLVYLKSVKEPVIISKAKSSHFLSWLEKC
jgi:DNA-binding LytR/AlgR family response regulator